MNRDPISFELNGGLGDRLCCMAAARLYARRNPGKLVMYPNLPDVLAAYGDNLVLPGRADDHHDLYRKGWQRHRYNGDQPPDFNYYGTYLWCMFGRAEDLRPEWPVYDPLPRRIIAIQPESVHAQNPPLQFVQAMVDRVIELTGRTVYAVGAASTPRAMENVDYSLLADSVPNLMRAIASADLLLTSRSASCNIAGGYDTPTFVWVPGDGEEWGLNYPGWRHQRCLWRDGADNAIKLLTEWAVNNGWI